MQIRNMNGEIRNKFQIGRRNNGSRRRHDSLVSFQERIKRVVLGHNFIDGWIELSRIELAGGHCNQPLKLFRTDQIVSPVRRLVDDLNRRAHLNGLA